MHTLALVASLLAVSPPALPEDAATIEGPSEAEPPVAEPPVAERPVAAEPDAIVILPPAPPADAGALPLAPELGGAASDPLVGPVALERIELPMQATPAPPPSGAGRFVGGAVSLLGGVGLLTAAAFEFSDGRDTTKPLISQLPAAIVMLAAGGTMIGTAARDQRKLSEWEAATRVNAKPMGTGLIIGGVTGITLGSLAAIATSIAVDMDLDAPRSIPAGWATAGVAIAGGTAMLIAGTVRRVHYGKWRSRITGTPMVAPTRAGATVGFAGQF
jgi:hypothetical protein